MVRFLTAAPALVALVLGVACTPDNIGYDAKADPFTQLEAAKTLARAEHKVILVVGGGDWCSSCHELHDFLAADARAQAALDSAFVQVHVYMGEDNYNEKFFAALPATHFVPNYWVLSADGKLLGVQDVDELQLDHQYDAARFEDFARAWRTGAALQGAGSPAVTAG